LIKQYQFKKEERLKSAVEIDNLFKNCRYFTSNPIKLIYDIRKEKVQNPLQVVITVPSRKFRNAADRNRIRRKMREIYRLNKHRIYSVMVQDLNIRLGIIYTGDDKAPEYELLEAGLLQCMAKLNSYIRKLSGGDVTDLH